MYRNGLLNDDPCSRITPFICEKDVENMNGSEDKTEVKSLETTEGTTEMRTSTTEETKEIKIWTTDKTTEITTSENTSGVENPSTAEYMPNDLLYDMFDGDLSSFIIERK